MSHESTSAGASSDSSTPTDQSKSHAQSDGKKAESSSQDMPKQPEFNPSNYNVSVFSQSNANNLANGMRKGVGNLVSGTACGLGEY